MRTLLLVGCVLVVSLPSSGGALALDCGVPAEMVEDEPQLPGLAEHLRQKDPIIIVAIGGASTAGAASGNAAENAYPHRLEGILRQRYPGVPITVLNKGLSRQTTQEMVDRFPRDVYSLSPSLVLWETGTFDAARSVDVDVFAAALEAGLADLREHRLDTMLINMQYSRGTASVINFEPYLAAMQRTADVDGVYVIRRFEMMKYWAETGVFNFVDVPLERRSQLAAEVYECVAERVADAIAYATR